MTEQLPLWGETPAPAPVPEHVERAERKGMIEGLFATGRMFTRNASRHRCPSCRAIVLSAVDGDLCASSVTVDPTPLDPQSELACKLAGRLTYRLRIREGRAQLDDRDPVWTGPAPEGATIVPEHRCGARFPGTIEALLPAARTIDRTAEPPF